ncbi:MAG: ubiquinol-cytochrome c reductase iron-sulfur subunit [Gaiellaceae bacterium]
MTDNSEHRDEAKAWVSPSLAPVGFAAGLILVLIGLVTDLIIFGVGIGVAVIAGFLWVYNASRDVRDAEEPEVADAARELASVEPEASSEKPERYSRGALLGGATLGLGGVIGAAITVPIVGFAVAPAFIDQKEDDIDLGPIDNFPEGQFVIANFDYKRVKNEVEAPSVARRTAYIRNNGFVEGTPSFTILSNRCVHLGCPVQPAGPTSDPQDVDGLDVTLIPVQPANFSCPCHGGAYDTEGNRTAGPPTRALDRYQFKIRNGNLVLAGRFSVSEVDGQAGAARIKAFKLYPPGTHVDGPDEWMTPWVS